MIDNKKPVLFVSHAGGDWQFYCSDINHDFSDDETIGSEVSLVHVFHLLDKDPTLFEIEGLPVDMGATRLFVGGKWEFFVDKD